MGPQETRMNLLTIVAGIAGAGGIAMVLYLATTAHTGLPWQKSTTVQAEFSDTHSLMAGNEVRQNSVRIGRVEGVEYQNGVAVATLSLDGHREIYADAAAEIWDFSALGTKFVELYPGSPESGKLTGLKISLAQTEGSSDIYELFDVLDDESRASAASAVRELGEGAAGRGRDLQKFIGSFPDLADDLGTISGALSADETNLPALLRSGNRLAVRFAGREDHITQLMKQADTTFRALAVDDATPLQDTLDKLPSALASLDEGFEALASPLSDTRTAMTALRPGAAALAVSEENVRAVLRDGVAPLRKVPGVAQQAVPAVHELTGTLADARPLASQVTRAFSDLAEPLGVLAPYGPEIGQFFVRGHSWTSQSLDGVNYARVGIAAPIMRAPAGLLGPDAVHQNPYPEPGEADNNRATSVLGGER